MSTSCNLTTVFELLMYIPQKSHLFFAQAEATCYEPNCKIHQLLKIRNYFLLAKMSEMSAADRCS